MRVYLQILLLCFYLWNVFQAYGGESSENSLDLLGERVLGETSKRSLFPWRESPLLVDFFYGPLLELNNFRSEKFGFGFDIPTEDFIWEISLGRVFVQDTAGSAALEQTPFRQSGRPSRFETDFGVALPLAEGIGSHFSVLSPPMEILLSFSTRIRLLHYPKLLQSQEWKNRLKSFFSMDLTEEEQILMTEHAPSSMYVERSKADLMMGLRLDLFAEKGFRVNGTTLIALPVLGTHDKEGLKYWWDIHLGLGYGF